MYFLSPSATVELFHLVDPNASSKQVLTREICIPAISVRDRKGYQKMAVCIYICVMVYSGISSDRRTGTLSMRPYGCRRGDLYAR